MASVVKSERRESVVDSETPSTSAFLASDVELAAELNFKAHQSRALKSLGLKAAKVEETTTALNMEVRLEPANDEPEEYLNGDWEVEPIQYCNFNPITSRLNDSLSIAMPGDAKRIKRGKMYRSIGDKDSNEYKCFQDEQKTLYKVGEYAYFEVDSSTPHMIGKIESFRAKKGAGATVKITRLYRRDDLIPDSLSLLNSERREAGIEETNDDIYYRELFPSESPMTQSVALLRGKCTVLYTPIRNAIIDGVTDEDLFFYCSNYSPDTGRISPAHTEIRVGEKYQAVCPPLEESCLGDEPDRDQLIYKPGKVCAEVEKEVAANACAYRNLALLKHPNINEIEQSAFKGDRCKLDALDSLNRCGYIAKDAMKQMVEDDNFYLEHQQFLSPDDVKKFVKGLRNYGKNFPKIVKEYLPLSTREALVNYYYWWKKSGDTFKPKKTASNANKKALYGQPKKSIRYGGGIAEMLLTDYESMSEDEESDTKDRACHHCFGSDSRDWHHSGFDRQLLCTACRLHFKKYGFMRSVNRPKDVPPSLLRDESQTNGNEENEEGVKTRASNRRDRLRTPNDGDRTPQRNSGDLDSVERRSTPQRSVKINKRNYNISTSSTDELPTPRKRDSRNKNLPPVLVKETNETHESDENDVSPPSELNKQPSTSDVEHVLKSEEPSPKRFKDEKHRDDLIRHRATTSGDATQIGADDNEDSEIASQLMVCEIRVRKDENCKLVRDSPDGTSCARVQLRFTTVGEPEWMIGKRKREELKKQKQLQSSQNGQAPTPRVNDAVNRPRNEPVLFENPFRQPFQQAAAPGLSFHNLPRAQQEILQQQMRLPTLPTTPMIRPGMNPHAPDLLNLNANQELLLQALAMQHQHRQMIGNPLVPPFTGAALPPTINPAIFYQMQQQAAQQARLVEEQQRRQQMEREEAQRIQQQQQQMLEFQNIAMGMLTPQMLAGANIPMNPAALMNVGNAAQNSQLQQQIMAAHQQRGLIEMMQRQVAGQIPVTSAGFPMVPQQLNAAQQIQQMHMLNLLQQQQLQRTQQKNDPR